MNSLFSVSSIYAKETLFSGISAKGEAEKPFIKRNVWECIQFISFSINEFNNLLCLSFYVSTDVLYAQKSRQREHWITASNIISIWYASSQIRKDRQTYIKGWHKRGKLHVTVEQDTLEASSLNWQLAGSKPQGVGFVQAAFAVMCLCH